MRTLLTALVAASLWQGSRPETVEAQQTSASSTPLARSFDRAVQRVQRRRDLQAHRGAGFDRDSFDVQAFVGLGRLEDSTLIRWFTGFSSFIGSTDSSACHELITGEPTGSRLATLSAEMDSAAIELWVADWEQAVVASYLAPARPKVSDEEMMVAVFTVLAKLPGNPMSRNRKPSDKPRKMTPASECELMRHFFKEALALEDPTRMTLLRGLALTINEKKGSPTFGEQ